MTPQKNKPSPKDRVVNPIHPGANSIGAMTPEGWHTRSEAARMIGRDPDTLKAWHRKGLAGNTAYIDTIPSGKMKAGLLEVHLYSDEDITKMQEFIATYRPARKGRGK